MKQNNIDNYYPVKTRSIATTIIYEDILYILYFLKIIKDFVVNIRNLLISMIKKIYLLLDYQIKKIKKSCSDLNINSIYIKINPKFKKYKIDDSSENFEETELLIQHNSYPDSINYQNKRMFNININLNLKFDSKVKKMYEPEVNLVADFEKNKIYNSYHQYINSTEQIYLTHDKSWGWFVDIEAQ